MDSINFYTAPHSRGRIVRWMLEEIGTPYEATVLKPGTSNQNSELLNLNPMGKVPTIKCGNTVVTEAAAICMYLADKFPDSNLAPNPDQRGDYYRWFLFAAGPLEAAITNKAFGFEVAEERQATVGYGSYDRVMNALELAVSNNSFIAGEQFTAADVYLGSQIGLGLKFGTVERRPAFEAYWERLSAREAYLRCEALEDELLKQPD